MVDVEGGAATLFVTPEGKSLLVDTGWPAGMGGARAVAGAPPQPSSADRIVAAAHKLGINRIDYLLISHYHVDHHDPQRLRRMGGRGAQAEGPDDGGRGHQSVHCASPAGKAKL